MTQTIPAELTTIHTQAWQHLTDAAAQANHAMHYLSLATIDQQGQPQSRLLVLRTADPAAATLAFHTDIRSNKWAELQENPQLSVLGYDSSNRLQLRLNGQVTLHGPDSTVQEKTWQQLSGWTRHSYCGGPPGHELNAPEITGIQTQMPDAVKTEPGQRAFGVICFHAVELDWFQHTRGALQRALFRYGTEGVLQSSGWIRP